MRGLHSSMVDFVPCDCKLQRFHSMEVVHINDQCYVVRCFVPQTSGKSQRDLVITSVLEEDPCCLG